MVNLYYFLIDEIFFASAIHVDRTVFKKIDILNVESKPLSTILPFFDAESNCPTLSRNVQIHKNHMFYLLIRASASLLPQKRSLLDPGYFDVV